MSSTTESVFPSKLATCKDIPPFNSILLSDPDDTEEYRRGVFFSGPAFRIEVTGTGKSGKTKSYICHKKGDKHFSLVHCDDYNLLKKEYSVCISLEEFLSVSIGGMTDVKVMLRNVIENSFKRNKEAFREEIAAVADNKGNGSRYLGYPTIEREIHSLISIFGPIGHNGFERQMKQFITNRKNLTFNIDSNDVKIPEYSVYVQGVQLFLEGIDGFDNQHSVTLSSREIDTTPRKSSLTQ